MAIRKASVWLAAAILLLAISYGVIASAAQWTPKTARVVPVTFAVYDRTEQAKPPQQTDVTYVKGCDWWLGITKRSGYTFDRDYNMSGYEHGIHVKIVVTPNP